MTSGDWKHIEEVFQDALRRNPPQNVMPSCGRPATAMPGYSVRLQSLLANHHEAYRFQALGRSSSGTTDRRMSVAGTGPVPSDSRYGCNRQL
jgi:hypothetical protein